MFHCNRKYEICKLGCTLNFDTIFAGEKIQRINEDKTLPIRANLKTFEEDYLDDVLENTVRSCTAINLS